MQGVDVWLNNPRRPLEASGTSGQKVVLNGGLNLSVRDGWVIPLYYQRDQDGLPSSRNVRCRSFSVPGIVHVHVRVHEAHDSHLGMAVQCGPHGDGLHVEMLRTGSRGDLERNAGHVKEVFERS